jgi:hypothetical protein
MDEQRAPAGTIMRALSHLAGDPYATDVDNLLERAATEIRDVDIRDQALQLLLKRCADDASRGTTWRRRVEAYVAEADGADSPITRVVLRQKALQLADHLALAICARWPLLPCRVHAKTTCR